MTDVLIVGAGPSGAVAATVLARAGARVRLIDRALFPRAKLCGDTLNPGTMAMLHRLGLARAADTDGLAVEGMRVTGENGVDIAAQYPDGLRGRAIARREFDQALVDEAVRAGAGFEPGVAVRGVVERGGLVAGVIVGTGSARHDLHAAVTIAADGRHSTIAFGLGLTRHPAQPRRWVVGAYFEGVQDMHARGEMHIRRGRYIGIAPLPAGLANVCVVRPSRPGDTELRDPMAALTRELSSDAMLRERFAHARPVTAAMVLGPLAVDRVDARVPDGLLLAGDAAGFIDPMTGDGLRFAVRGGEIAALGALRALEHGWSGVHAALTATRRAEFAGKIRFNRTLRTLVASDVALRIAAMAAPLAPAALRAVIVRAGDCRLAIRERELARHALPPHIPQLT